MEQYWVEGVYVTCKGIMKVKRGRQAPQADIEPFLMSFWTNGPEEALQAANEKLEGGQWIEEPRVTRVSEEQRMRAMGAPELPGLSLARRKRI
jgi:hypothetical protein